MSTKSEALRLADWCEAHSSGIYRPSAEAAAELRRLYALLEAEQALHQRVTYPELQRLRTQRDELLKALKDMLLRDEKNTCRHEETHRGGAIWEICDSCGSMWADDEGGKPEWEDPKEWTQARAAIAAVEGANND